MVGFSEATTFFCQSKKDVAKIAAGLASLVRLVRLVSRLDERYVSKTKDSEGENRCSAQKDDMNISNHFKCIPNRCNHVFHSLPIPTSQMQFLSFVRPVIGFLAE
jgi:hypothetical protein